MKLYPGKTQNFQSWDYSPRVPHYQMSDRKNFAIGYFYYLYSMLQVAYVYEKRTPNVYTQRTTHLWLLVTSCVCRTASWILPRLPSQHVSGGEWILHEIVVLPSFWDTSNIRSHTMWGTCRLRHIHSIGSGLWRWTWGNEAPWDKTQYIYGKINTMCIIYEYRWNWFVYWPWLCNKVTT